MTKKDYVAIAAVFNKQRIGALGIGDREQADAIEALALAITNTLQEDNPRFDRERFLTACGNYGAEKAAPERITINYYAPIDFPAIGSVIEKNGKRWRVVDNSTLHTTTAEEVQ